MNTKERLAAIFNALRNVETKGESTLILADCMREIAQMLNEMPDLPAQKNKGEEADDSPTK